MNRAERASASGNPSSQDPAGLDEVVVKEGLFVEDPDGSPRLSGGLCKACWRYHFPSLSICPYCSSEAVRQQMLSPRGTLWGWTAVTAPPPGYQGEVPYGFGIVELPEGIRVVTRLTEPDPSKLTFGQPMVLRVVSLHTDDKGRAVMTYAFAPSGDPL